MPGTVQATNWSYRMLPTLEDLNAHEELRAAIERTRNPSVRPDTPVTTESKKRVYVRFYF